MEEKLISIIEEALDVRKGSLGLDTGKDEVDEWDSLGHLIVVSMVESEFKVKIPFEKVSGINKARDFLKYLK